jgi:hypothetical protein
MLPGFDLTVSDDSKKVPTTRGGSASSVGSLLKNYQPKPKNKYVSREFQDYGYRLAMELDDHAHASLYIRLAKTVNRGLLETARRFVIDSQAKSKAKLFMWKLKELRAS